MALESVTIGTILNRVKFHMKNATATDAVLDPEITMAIHWSLRDLVSKTNLPSFRTETTVAVSVGGGLSPNTSRDFALADDFERIIEPGVRHDGSPYETLHYYEQQDYDGANGAASNQGGRRPAEYTIRGRSATTGLWTIRFAAPTDASYTIRYSYLALPTDHSASTSVTELDRRFPRHFWQGLVWGALINFPQYLSNEQMLVYQQKYVEVMKAMIDRGEPIVGNVREGVSYGNKFAQRGRVAWPSALYTGQPYT